MWTKETLLTKARAVFEKAEGASDEADGEAAFWSIVGLELLLRAVVASKSPVLLAEPSKGHWSGLFACGVQVPEDAELRSRGTADLLVYGQGIMRPQFGDAEFNLFRKWLNHRNEYLHSAGANLASLTSSEWQPEVYRLCSIILAAMNLTLADMLGKATATAAQEMITSMEKDATKAARDKAAEHGRLFAALSSEEQAEKREYAKSAPTAVSPGYRSKRVECPGCHSQAVLFGSHVRSAPVKEVDGGLQQDEIYLASMLNCPACKLVLSGQSLLRGVKLGGTFTVTEVVDPTDFMVYEPDYEPDYYEPDVDDRGE